MADHLEEVAILERLQCFDIVYFLQAENVGARGGDGERGQLARVVGVRDGPGLFQQPELGLVADLEKRQRAVLLKLVAVAGEVEPVHQVLDIERGETQGHATRFACCRRRTQARAARPPGTILFIARSSCPH